MFPVDFTRDELQKMEWVVGAILDGRAVAAPLDALRAADELPFTVESGDETFAMHYNEDADYAWVENAGGEVVPSVRAYWFAWQAFHPETRLVRPGADRQAQAATSSDAASS
jgi:hypothetical protein